MWTPNGYNRTLSQMEHHKFVVNVRFKPYLELANFLRNHNYEGIFECHVTVENESPEHMEKFLKTCEAIGCRAILIELPTGQVQRQLMTSSYHTGNVRDVITQAYKISQEFAKSSLSITRTKIEALFSNKGVPETDEDAKLLSPENYFDILVPFC